MFHVRFAFDFFFDAMCLRKQPEETKIYRDGLVIRVNRKICLIFSVTISGVKFS